MTLAHVFGALFGGVLSGSAIVAVMVSRDIWRKRKLTRTWRQSVKEAQGGGEM